MDHPARISPPRNWLEIVLPPCVTAAEAARLIAEASSTGHPRPLTRAELDARDDRIYRADCIRERSHRHGG